MLGYPGAGKTTTAEVIQELTGAVHLSSDRLRAEMFQPPTFSQEEHGALYEALDQQTEKMLAEGRDVIYDANLNRYQHRQDKYNICERTGANSILVWVQTPKNVAKERAIDQTRSHLVPHGETAAEMFERIADIIEEPAAKEPYIAVDGTKVSQEYVTELLQN